MRILFGVFVFVWFFVGGCQEGRLWFIFLSLSYIAWTLFEILGLVLLGYATNAVWLNVIWHLSLSSYLLFILQHCRDSQPATSSLCPLWRSLCPCNSLWDRGWIHNGISQFWGFQLHIGCHDLVCQFQQRGGLFTLAVDHIADTSLLDFNSPISNSWVSQHFCQWAVEHFSFNATQVFNTSFCSFYNTNAM